jgi:hypothetical protein
MLMSIRAVCALLNSELRPLAKDPKQLFYPANIRRMIAGRAFPRPTVGNFPGPIRNGVAMPTEHEAFWADEVRAWIDERKEYAARAASFKARRASATAPAIASAAV